MFDLQKNNTHSLIHLNLLNTYSVLDRVDLKIVRTAFHRASGLLSCKAKIHTWTT